ncbi:hypothetical protein N8299_04585 [Gammaproteobacteria bacterium]|nr:hypothetical protein [Gammaproteobacteria bacterium]
MKNTLALVLMVLGLVGCNVAPIVDASWMNSNCSAVYSNTSSCQNLFSNCSCNASTKNYRCTMGDGIFAGQMKDGLMHGNGSYKWNDGTSFKGVFRNDKKWCGIEKKGSTYFLYKDGDYTQGEEGVDWGLVAGVVVVAAAAYAVADAAGDSSGGGSSNSSSSSPSTCSYTLNYEKYTIDNPYAGWGSCPSTHNYEEPEMCSVYSYASRECDTGKACGDSCISEYKTCHVGKGSACNKNYRSYP